MTQDQTVDNSVRLEVYRAFADRDSERGQSSANDPVTISPAGS
jgi:hypothetical protein